MRTPSLLAMAAACVALAGCNTSGGEGGHTAPLALCGLACPDPGGGGGGGGNDPGTDPGGGGGGGGGGTGGNTKLSGGDTTIALEGGALVSPPGGSYSKLTITQNPSTATFQIDTKQKGGGEWNEAVPMTEFPAGTNLPSLFTAANGFDPALHPDNLNATKYTEYRNISATGGTTDEVLQVWNFGDKNDGSDSYVTQYRSVGNGGEAAQQAFSFGGTKTPVDQMPTSATGTYAGSYGATVKAWNWIPPDIVDPEIGNIDPNGLFMVNGLAEITADFGAATVNGTLTPTSWKFAGSDNWYYYDVVDNAIYTRNGDNSANFVSEGYAVPGYFGTQTHLTAKITGNTYAGKANLGDSFVSGDNPTYGAFFGAGAKETTGIFSVLGVSPQPIGGEYPINDDRRAYVQQSGVFNAKCQAGGACAP